MIGEKNAKVGKMKLYREVLSSAQKKLSADIQQIRSCVPHSGEKGVLVEERIRSELQKILPEKVGVSHGFVTDASGEISRQLDIILYDRWNTPRILTSGGTQIFPVESTYACGEIKTNLNAETFEDTFKKCESYKSLTREAYFERNSLTVQSFSLFGREYDQWQSIFFCIAVESVSEKTLLKKYTENVDENRLVEEKCKDRVDGVFSLNGPCIINSSKPLINDRPQRGTIDLLPNQSGKFCSYPAKEPWALFVFLLLRYMVQVPQVCIDMLRYDSGEPF